MAEPLLAALAARGERLVVAALPWVAPVFEAMAEVAETLELPFAHGRLDWSARRRIAMLAIFSRPRRVCTSRAAKATASRTRSSCAASTRSMDKISS